MTLLSNVEYKLPIGGEFLGYTGDCTEYAYMVGKASAIPTAPCDKTELDRLTAEAIANHFTTSPTGSMTPGNLASLCHLENVPFTQTTGGNMISMITQNAGKHPIVLQVSNGSQLPGNEGGVNGHAVCILAYDESTQLVTIANGDSVNGRAGHIDVIHLQDIQNANPFAVTVLELEMGTPYDKFFTITAGKYTLIENPNLVVDMGILNYWLSIDGLPGLPVDNRDYSLEAQNPGHTVAFQVFERGIIVYDPDHVIDTPPTGGDYYLAHISDSRFKVVQPAKTPSLNLGSATISGSDIVVPFTLE